MPNNISNFKTHKQYFYPRHSRQYFRALKREIKRVREGDTPTIIELLSAAKAEPSASQPGFKAAAPQVAAQNEPREALESAKSVSAEAETAEAEVIESKSESETASQAESNCRELRQADAPGLRDKKRALLGSPGFNVNVEPDLIRRARIMASRTGVIYFVSALCGAGKTGACCNFIAENINYQNFVYAAPSLKLLRDFKVRLKDSGVAEDSILIVTHETYPNRVKKKRF